VRDPRRVATLSLLSLSAGLQRRSQQALPKPISGGSLLGRQSVSPH